jgi:hypothetical protein
MIVDSNVAAQNSELIVTAAITGVFDGSPL